MIKSFKFFKAIDLKVNVIHNIIQGVSEKNLYILDASMSKAILSCVNLALKSARLRAIAIEVLYL